MSSWTLFHEAAHAVVATMRDLPLEGIYLDRTELSKDTYAPARTRFRSLEGEEFPLQRANIDDVVLMAAAGGVSTQVFFNAYDAAGSIEDLQAMASQLTRRNLDHSTEAMLARWLQAESDARSLLEGHALQVQAVVALLQAKLNDGEDFASAEEISRAIYSIV